MAKRPTLPDLASTGRRYRDDTLRVRLQSPGIERYPAKGGASRGGRVIVAALLAAALVTAMVWLAR